MKKSVRTVLDVENPLPIEKAVDQELEKQRDELAKLAEEKRKKELHALKLRKIKEASEERIRKANKNLLDNGILPTQVNTEDIIMPKQKSLREWLKSIGRK